MRGAVVVTGLGAISALGTGVRTIVGSMREGRDGLSVMERDEILRALHPIRFAGWLREPWERGEIASLDAWARAAAREAWEEADAASAGIAPERVAIVVGTTVGDDGAITRIADSVASELGARGPRWTISTACASSTNAIGLGRDLLHAGDADLVICGGAELLVPGMFAGFAALDVLAAEKCSPFGETVGTTLGEGAGFVVLEREGARAVRAHAYVAGYGLASDAWHETTPDPRGEGLARATVSCLRDAGLDPSEIDYVNAHGTGTAANDDSEWRGIQRALGARAPEIPISASKGFFGHAQGACGALEAIATIACMREGLVPPSLRVGRGRKGGPSDTVAEGTARPAEIAVALTNSAAFGGANAVVALSRSPRARESAHRAISIAGLGAIATERGAARDDVAIARAAGDADLEHADPSARLAIAASVRALADAGVRVRGELRNRTGIFGGASQPPAASVAEFKRSLDRGLDRASAPAFARTVGHAPIGVASRVLGLRGPITMVAGDGVAGLLAIVYAARWLRDRDDADRILAGGLDERAVDTEDAEGAAIALLCAGSGGPRIAGAATAAHAEDAIARALAEAGRTAADVQVWARPHGPDASSFRSAMACVDAVRAIREGARCAVASAEGPQGAAALVIVEENA